MHEASVGDDLDFRGNTIGVDWRGYFSIPILLLELRLQSCIGYVMYPSASARPVSEIYNL